MVGFQHILLKNSESKEYNNDKFYPLGILIQFKNKELYIKSQINKHLKFYLSNVVRYTKSNNELRNLLLEGYFSDNIFNQIMKERVFPFKNLLDDEINIFSEIIKIKGEDFLEEATTDLLIREFSKYTTEITDIFDRQLSLKYRQELRDLFTYSIDKDYENRIFLITNFLLHFINWDASFYHFYDSAFDIIPGIIHIIETRISHDLRTSIRAYRAYYNQVNVLKRIFKKREEGKISTLSYLDWENEIKDILFQSFSDIFGERTGKEYIQLLNKLIEDFLK